MRLPSTLHAAAGNPDPRRDTHDAEGRCYWCAGDYPEVVAQLRKIGKAAP